MKIRRLNDIFLEIENLINYIQKSIDTLDTYMSSLFDEFTDDEDQKINDIYEFISSGNDTIVEDGYRLRDIISQLQSKLEREVQDRMFKAFIDDKKIENIEYEDA